MAEYPALPLWTDAYLGDTRHLTTEQHGAYLLLLIEAWRRPLCRLPDDDALLARLAGLTTRAWANHKPVVMQPWVLADGAWTQKRLSAERAYVDAASKRAKEAADKRWNKVGNANADANASAEHRPSIFTGNAPTPTPTPTTEYPKKDIRSSARKPLVEIDSLDAELRSIADTEGIDAAREFENCRDWCADNRKPLTKARVRRWFRDNRFRSNPGGTNGPRPDRPRTGTEALLADPEFRAAATRLVDGAGGGNGPADAAFAPGGTHGGNDRPAGESGGQIPSRSLPKPAGRGGHSAGRGDARTDGMDGVSGAGGSGETDRRADGVPTRIEPIGRVAAAPVADGGADRAGERGTIGATAVAGVPPSDRGAHVPAGQHTGAGAFDGLDIPDFMRRAS